MNKSAMIRARIEEKLKEDVGKVFDKLGLSTTEAITLFYKQIKLHKGLPFSVKIPGEVTKKTFEETGGKLSGDTTAEKSSGKDTDNNFPHHVPVNGTAFMVRPKTGHGGKHDAG